MKTQKTPKGYKKTKIGIIPTDWEVKKLQSQVYIDRKTLKSSFDEEYINYVSLSDIKNGKIYPNEIMFKDAPSRARRIAPKNSILLATVRPNLKNFAIVDRDNIIASTGFAVLEEKKIDINFLLNFLYSYQAEKQYFNLTVGSNYPALNSVDVKSLKIPIPPKTEQENIAKVLTTWDKAIEKLLALITAKKQQKKALMQSIFNGELKIDNEKWTEVKLGEVFNNKGGTALEKYTNEKGKYHFISIGNYSTSGIYIDDNKRIVLNDVTKHKLLNKNDLVMVLNDKTKEGNIIGSTILIDENDKYIYNQRSERLIIKSDLNPKFSWYLLNTTSFRKEVFKNSQGGTQIYVNFSSVKEIKISIPPLSTQEKIANILSTADKEIAILENKLATYKEQKKGLMQVLLTGKVRIMN